MKTSESAGKKQISKKLKIEQINKTVDQSSFVFKNSSFATSKKSVGYKVPGSKKEVQKPEVKSESMF